MDKKNISNRVAMGESGCYSALEACCAELNGEVAMMGRTVERLAQTNGALVSLSESMARFVAAATAVRASFDAAESEASAAAAIAATPSSEPNSPQPASKSAKSAAKSSKKRPTTLAEMRERAKTPKGDADETSSAADVPTLSASSAKMQAHLRDKLPKRYQVKAIPVKSGIHTRKHAHGRALTYTRTHARTHECRWMCT